MTNLDRRELNRLLLGAALSCAIPFDTANARSEPRASARRLYERAVVIDSCGGPGAFEPDRDPSAGWSDAVVADAKASGITAVNVTIGAVGNAANVFEETVAALAAHEREIERHPDVFMRIARPAQLLEAKSGGRIGLIYGLQDASMLGPDIERVHLFYHLGVRIIQPTYNGRNLLGDGCLEPANAGLSRFGREVIERMSALGILLDLSHCGQRTAAEAMAAVKIPVAFTHSACRALVDMPRNRTDAEMRAVADKGGYFGVYLMPFLRSAGQPSGDDVVRHLEHAINVCGEDHVGIGTDGTISRIELTEAYRAMHRKFVADRRKQGIAAPGEDENVFNFVPDLNTPARLATLAELLLARGHGEARVEKILGGNFTRVFTEALHA